MEQYIGVMIFVVVMLVALLLNRYIFAQVYKKKKSTTITFMRSLISIIIMTVLIFGVLSQFSATKDISTTILQSGSLIIAIATFAAQKVLGNVISGLVISSVKPFDIGEKIILMSGGQKVLEGVVLGINLRHTTIRGLDDKISLVPNGVLDEMVIVNADNVEKNGYFLEMECSFDSDVDRAIEIMAEEIRNNPLTVNRNIPQSKVLCSGFTANGFVLKSVIWTESINDNYLACSQLRVSIFKAWKAEGIEIPYQTVTFDNPLELRKAAKEKNKKAKVKNASRISESPDDEEEFVLDYGDREEVSGEVASGPDREV